MASETITKWKCDLCENAAEIEGTLTPIDWGVVEVKVSWSSGTWAHGVVCHTCLELSRGTFPSMQHSGRIAAKLYNLFCRKKKHYEETK